MEEFNIEGKQTSFYKYCPRTFGYILVYCCTLFPKYYKLFPVDMNAVQYLGHVSYVEYAVKEVGTKCAVPAVVTIGHTVFISRIPPPPHSVFFCG